MTAFDIPPDDKARFVAIPLRTVEAEIELRRQFASSLADPVLSHKLLGDLNIPKRELANFSVTVRSSGRLSDWLTFKNRNPFPPDPCAASSATGLPFMQGGFMRSTNRPEYSGVRPAAGAMASAVSFARW